jgi:hypothetical protein
MGLHFKSRDREVHAGVVPAVDWAFNPVDWEESVSVAIPVIAIATLFVIAYTRDKRSQSALRAFAGKHGLRFTEAQVTKGVLARGEGRLDGKDLHAGYTWVRGFVEGIGPRTGGTSIAVVAMTIGSTSGIDRNAPAVQKFLQSNGSLTDSVITYAFPKRHFKAISGKELDAALALVRQVAAAGR